MSDRFVGGIPRLCYIEGCYAYFGTLSPERMWGDDWNDSPYQHNAGTPYAWAPYMLEKQSKPKYELYRVEWYGRPKPPEDMPGNWSVEDMNSGAIPWLYAPYEVLFAGATIPDFHAFIRRHGGASHIAERWPVTVENPNSHD